MLKVGPLSRTGPLSYLFSVLCFALLRDMLNANKNAVLLSRFRLRVNGFSKYLLDIT